MIGSTGKWTSRLVDAILADNDEAIIQERLDALVRWLAGVKEPQTESIRLEFEKRDTNEKEAQQFVLITLDPILFHPGNNAWNTLGLIPGAGREELKTRYYRLTKIYHPDRQLSDEKWLNERAEKLNAAYDQIKRDTVTAERPDPQPVNTPDSSARGQSSASTANVTANNRNTPSPFGDWLRTSLGGASTFQRRVFLGMAALATLVIVLFTIEENEPYIPRTHPQKNASLPLMQDTSATRQAPEVVTNVPVPVVVNENSAPPVEEIAVIRQTSEVVTKVPEPVAVSEVSVLPVKETPATRQTPEVVTKVPEPVAVSEVLVLPVKEIPATRQSSEVDTRVSAPIAESEVSSPPVKETPVTRQSPEVVDNVPASAVVNKASTSRLQETQVTKRSPGIVANQDSAQLEQERIQKKVRFFLTQYANFYADGNATELARLYMENGRQERLQGREKIENFYNRFFGLTEVRALYFEIEDIQVSGHEYRVASTYRANLVYRGGRKENLVGNAKFLVNSEGDYLAISDAVF